MENYETLGTIGEGTYGIVLKARHKETGQIVAIKKFKESDEDEQVRKTALREVRILKQLKHDNIVNLIEVFRRKGKLHLVFEFVERTILEDLERNPDGMDPLETKKCLWQLLRSIEYCHSHHVIHRDIKPENLLVSRNGTLKLCDFGFARTLAGPGARYTDYVATRWYRGPELLTGDTQYGKPVDIWAIGCMLPEMASGAPLFPGESDIDQLFHIMRCFGNLPPHLMEVFRSNPLFIGIKLPENMTATETLDRRFPTWSEEQLSFMKNCLKYEPEQRCTCAELMQHPYFTEDGFVQWFEGELKQMLERDAQDFKMRQKKFRKNKGGANPHPERAQQQQMMAHQQQMPQQQPHAAHHSHPPPFPPPAKEMAPLPPALPSKPSTPMSSYAHADEENEWERQPQQAQPEPPLNSSPHADRSSVGPDLTIDRRPATRDSSFSFAKSDGGEQSPAGEMPMLPNLNRPITPRAQRLVAFPHLASALEEQNGTLPQSRTWGNASGALPPAPSGKSSRLHPEVPSMPQLQHGPTIATRRSDVGCSNLPQLQEGLPFANTDMQERSAQPYVPVAPAPRGTGKKKGAAFDPGNPYCKPVGKLKKQSSKGMHSGQAMGGSQMGVVGQGSSMSGLAAAYAPPGSSGGYSSSSHFDSSSHFGAPPRTPQDGMGADSHGAQGLFGFVPPPVHGSKASHGYGGGQYAKYGKRY